MSKHNSSISSLLQNSINSIQLGFEDYFLMLESPDDRRVISSIRNLHAGVLLLLKAKIQELTPKEANNALIMTRPQFKIDGDRVIVIGNTNGKTIDCDEIINRLKMLGIPFDKKTNKLVELINIRNEIEHHFCNKPKEELEGAILSQHIFYSKISKIS